MKRKSKSEWDESPEKKAVRDIQEKFLRFLVEELDAPNDIFWHKDMIIEREVSDETLQKIEKAKEEVSRIDKEQTEQFNSRFFNPTTGGYTHWVGNNENWCDDVIKQHFILKKI
jgi:hypothetical protein